MSDTFPEDNLNLKSVEQDISKRHTDFVLSHKFRSKFFNLSMVERNVYSPYITGVSKEILENIKAFHTLPEERVLFNLFNAFLFFLFVVSGPYFHGTFLFSLVHFLLGIGYIIWDSVYYGMFASLCSKLSDPFLMIGKETRAMTVRWIVTVSTVVMLVLYDMIYIWMPFYGFQKNYQEFSISSRYEAFLEVRRQINQINKKEKENKNFEDIQKILKQFN